MIDIVSYNFPLLQKHTLLLTEEWVVGSYAAYRAQIIALPLVHQAGIHEALFPAAAKLFLSSLIK